MNTEQPPLVTHRASTRDWLWIGVIALAVFLFDQLTKVWAVATLKGQPPLVVIQNYFYFGYSENTGIAFGLFQDHSGWLHVVVPLAFLILLYLIYKHFAESHIDIWYLIIFGFLIGGACGNIFDRLMYGYVVDFIDVFIPVPFYGVYHWPTFNIADSALTVGQVLLIAKLLFFEQAPESNATPEEGVATALKVTQKQKD